MIRAESDRFFALAYPDPSIYRGILASPSRFTKLLARFSPLP